MRRGAAWLEPVWEWGARRREADGLKVWKRVCENISARGGMDWRDWMGEVLKSRGGEI